MGWETRGGAAVGGGAAREDGVFGGMTRRAVSVTRFRTWLCVGGAADSDR